MGQRSSLYQSWTKGDNTDSRTRQTDRRHGIGSVIFVLGMPFSIVGVILTIVAYANTKEHEGVPVFDIIGPFFLGLAALCVVIGAFVAQLVEKRHIMACCCIQNGKRLCQYCRRCYEGRDAVSHLEQRRASVDSKHRLNITSNFSDTSGSRPASCKSDETSAGSKSIVSVRLCKIYPSSIVSVSELPDVTDRNRVTTI